MTALRLVLLCLCCGCSSPPPTTVGVDVKNAQPRPLQLNETTDVKELVERINEYDPSQRHYSVTPAVSYLTARGPSVIPHVLPLMESDDEDTRIRAHSVLVGVTSIMHGFRVGRGWGDIEQEGRWQQWWQEMGNLKADSPKEDRIRAIKLWQAWLDKQRG